MGKGTGTGEEGDRYQDGGASAGGGGREGFVVKAVKYIIYNTKFCHLYRHTVCSFFFLKTVHSGVAKSMFCLRCCRTVYRLNSCGCVGMDSLFGAIVDFAFAFRRSAAWFVCVIMSHFI